MSIRIPPPLQTTFWGGVMWGANCASPNTSLELNGLKNIGSIFAAIGIIILFISIGAFIKARTTVNPINPEKASELVTGGLYRISRNPMYLGMLFLLIGWGFMLANPISIIGIIGFVIVMNIIQIKPEERALEILFGDSYLNYKNKVRRWI